ncbi:thiamine ABC transporter substrate-binding protein [Propioniciclava flava]|nr:thiamine ABC transporter substrate-binding protein [Propioniciclava flava]
MSRTFVGGLAAALAAALALTGCSSSAASTPSSAPATLTVVTHDSFNVSPDLLASFEKSSGLKVTYVAPGDAGTLVNQLVLTKDSPLGDVVYGIDNTFAGRALSEQVTTPYTSTALPAADADALKADGSDRLTPIDFGDVCVNADTAWFSAHHLAVPQTLEDLTKPEYKDLLVVPNPASSSPGMAFLTATVGASGDPGYLGYWTALKNNGVLIAKDWTETYSVQFSGSAGKGPRPLALSYSTSPASEVVNGAAPTQALLQTCFRQVEYAGVIAGAKNPEGAKKFIDFMLSQQVQADIPGQMYMYPALRSATLPADWVSFAPLSPSPYAVPAATITADRDRWIRDWTATVVG